MSIVTITLNNKTFQLACSQEQETELHELSLKLNDQITELKKSNPSASYELLLVMTALSLQDLVGTLSKQLNAVNQLGQDYPEEKSAQTLNSLAEYLENLAQKLEKC